MKHSISELQFSLYETNSTWPDGGIKGDIDIIYSVTKFFVCEGELTELIDL